MNVSKSAQDGVKDFDGDPYRTSLHLPRSREPTGAALTLVGAVLALIGAAFAAGYLVGAGMRVASWIAQ